MAGQLAVDDAEEILGQTEAPVAVAVQLSEAQRQAAKENRLWVWDIHSRDVTRLFPAQCLSTDGKNAALGWLMPPGQKGKREFGMEIAPPLKDGMMQAHRDSASGQYDLLESGRPVLRYNYASVEPGDIAKQVKPNNLKYTVARSDYIHPLYGPGGEKLTQDWSLDHPHHRGIYWAWPEVDWRGQRGDIHALQKVFARPTGQCTVTDGPVFAQVDAENLWKWEDREAILRERTIIRAYRATSLGRLVDMEFQFTALSDPVLIARRETKLYGGLNLRLGVVKDQQLTKHTDSAEANLRRAWSEVHGLFESARQPAGVVVMQNKHNPDYPGDWIEYPNLNWLQPTFPASGTRYEITKENPLILRYRIWIHGGAKAEIEACARQWDAAHSPCAPNVLKPSTR